VRIPTFRVALPIAFRQSISGLSDTLSSLPLTQSQVKGIFNNVEIRKGSRRYSKKSVDNGAKILESNYELTITAMKANVKTFGLDQ
jgi:hypothetical protein